MIFNRNPKRINMGPAIGKEKRGRSSRSKLSSKILSKTSRNSIAKPRSKTTKVEKPIGPGTRLGASSMAPILIDSDDEETPEDGTASGGVYVPGSLLTRPTSTRGSNLKQDLNRFRCTSHLLSPTPSQASLYSPISNIFAPTGFILRRANTAPLLPPLTAVNDERSERTSYVTPPITTGDDIRERESSLFMSALRPVNCDRPTTMRDARTSELFSRVKPDTPGPYKFRTGKATSESKPEMQQEAAKTLHLPQLLSQDNSFSIESASKAIRELQPARVVRNDEDDEEVMVKVDPNDLDYDCDSDATDAIELEIAAEQRRLARIESKSKHRPTNSISKVSKSRKRTKSIASKSVRSKRVYPSNICVTKTRKHRRNSIDRDFLMSDNEFYVESDYSSASSSDDDRISSNDSDVEMNDLGNDCTDLRINMTKKYAFNAGILKKQKQKAGN